ncbi:MAG: serine/threonine-protein kinase, partial [Bryobacteraceae bacterium]
MIPAGTVLGAYEVRSLIGAGGMGEVYRAHDRRLRRDVALKILPAALLGDPARHERFAQEARAASALSHPRIVAIFDVNLEGDPPYIVFELVEGASLRKTIERGPVPVRQLLDLATQIADGLSAAHKAGFAHRDLKPENILVTPEGRPKILDFGLAKQLGPLVSAGQETVTLPVTAARTVLGTVHYMSPEQARGEQVDIRSDIFSFGVILYEMATGKRPFDRASPVETLSAIISSDPPRIEVEIPLSLRLMIERCMAKDREERYHSTR